MSSSVYEEPRQVLARWHWFLVHPDITRIKYRSGCLKPTLGIVNVSVRDEVSPKHSNMHNFHIFPNQNPWFSNLKILLSPKSDSESWGRKKNTYIIGRIQVQVSSVICSLIYPVRLLFVYGIWQHFWFYHFDNVFCLFLVNSSVDIGFLSIVNCFKQFNVQFLKNELFTKKKHLRYNWNLLYLSL